MFHFDTAYLKNSAYTNVIVVDWKPLNASRYRRSVNMIVNVGTQVARMIDFLKIFGGLLPSSTTLVGHSLGAHITGAAGHQITVGKVNQIFGNFFLFEKLFTVILEHFQMNLDIFFIQHWTHFVWAWKTWTQDCDYQRKVQGTCKSFTQMGTNEVYWNLWVTQTFIPMVGRSSQLARPWMSTQMERVLMFELCGFSENRSKLQ